MKNTLTTFGSALVSVAFLASAAAPLAFADASVNTDTNSVITASAQDVSVSTTENTPIQITLVGSTTASSALSYQLIGSISSGGGSLSLSGNTVTYTPLTGFTGQDSFLYEAQDSNGISAPAKVTIQVNGSGTTGTGTGTGNGSGNGTGSGTGQNGADLVLTVPNATVGTSTLIASTNGMANNNSDVTAAVAGKTPIVVTLANTGNAASDNVRIAPVGDTSGHLQLWAQDSTGTWYDINKTGWGPASGFPVAANSTNSTNVYAFSDQPGTYTATIKVLNVSDNSVATSTQATLTVTGSTSGNGTGGNTGGTGSSTLPVIVVTPSNHQGWSIYTDSSASTTATSTFVTDPTAPLGSGALELSTPGNSDEIMFDRVDATMTPVADINLSYATKRLSGTPYAAPSYVLGIDEDGNASTTNDVFYAWYEPVYNGGSNYDNWNTWTLNQSSKFWSTSMVGTKGGANGANLFTLQDVKNAYPNAAVNEYTINLGSGNPGWSALVDDVVTPSAIYNFEPDQATSTGSGSGQTVGTGYSSNTGGGAAGTGGGSSVSNSGGSTGPTTTVSQSTTGQVLGAAAFNFTRDLFLGLTGADVTELQTELIAAGYSIPAGVTGYFGLQTRAAVAAWQAAHNIFPSAGYFGPISRAKYAVDGGFHILTTPVTSSSVPGCQVGYAYSTTTGQACK